MKTPQISKRKSLLTLNRIAVATVAGIGLLAGVATAQSGQNEQRDADAKVDMTPVADVVVKGEGDRAMVLIPGLAADERVWLGFMERHKKDFEMHAITLPGFAGTAPPGSPPSAEGTPWLDNAVKAIEAYIEENGLEDPVIVGHSMGAHIALKFGIESDAASKIVSLDGSPVFPLPPDLTEAQRKQTFQMIAMQMASVTDQQWRQQVQQMTLSLEDLEAGRDITDMMLETPFENLRQYILELSTNDLTPKLSELDEPTLVISAIQPAEIPPYFTPDSYKEFWRSSMADAPNAQVVFFDGVGHFIVQEQPEALDKALDEFLAGKKVEAFKVADENAGQATDSGQ